MFILVLLAGVCAPAALLRRSRDSFVGSFDVGAGVSLRASRAFADCALAVMLRVCRLSVCLLAGRVAESVVGIMLHACCVSVVVGGAVTDAVLACFAGLCCLSVLSGVVLLLLLVLSVAVL